jgi:hypothetical protein
MRRFLVALTALLVLTGCSDDTTSPDSATGLYVLQTIDDDPLPEPIFSDLEVTLWVVSGYTSLEHDGDYTQSATIVAEYADGTIESEEVSGSGAWKRNGSEILLTDNSNGAEYSLTLSGSSLSEFDEDVDMEFVYQKQ